MRPLKLYVQCLRCGRKVAARPESLLDREAAAGYRSGLATVNGHVSFHDFAFPVRAWKEVPSTVAGLPWGADKQLTTGTLFKENWTWEIYMKGFLVGFGLGVAAGMLLAPMRGEDARVMAGVKASEIGDNARETYQQVKDTVGKAVDSVRNGASTPSTGTHG